MVFYAVTTTGISFNIFAEYFWYSLIAILGFAITGIIFLKFLNKDIVTELPPFILPNTGTWDFHCVYLLMALKVLE